MLSKFDAIGILLCFLVVLGCGIYAKSVIADRREEVRQFRYKPTVVRMVPTSITVNEVTGKTNVVIEIVTE